MKRGTLIGSNVYNMHAQTLGRYLEGQGRSMTLQQNRVSHITLLFAVRFLITILRRHVASKILVATLKVKVTA